MADTKKILQKYGALNLFKEFWHAGNLFYAVGQILLTGKSLKSLELLRLGAKMRVHNRLSTKFLPVLRNFDSSYSSEMFPKLKSNKVWFFWMQGLENAPALVQRCYRSLQENLKDREIVLLTEKNMDDYVQFPDFIKDKLNRGVITYTHLSDLLRVELLIRYGGTWIDSTVFCSGTDIPRYMFDADFFVFQNLRPGDNGDVLNFSSWFMTSCSNNKILLATRELLYAYWKKNNRMVDYFLLHHFVMIVARYYKEDWNKIIQFPNSLPHVLLLMLMEPFNQEKWDAIVSICPFHKLTYKLKGKTMEKNSFYQFVMDS